MMSKFMDNFDDGQLNVGKWVFLIAGGLLSLVASIIGEIQKTRKTDASIERMVKERVNQVLPKI